MQSENIIDPIKTTRNIKRLLKGYKETNCYRCNDVMYVDNDPKGSYTCWPCLFKNNPEYVKEHASKEVKKWIKQLANK